MALVGVGRLLFLVMCLIQKPGLMWPRLAVERAGTSDGSAFCFLARVGHLVHMHPNRYHGD